MRKPALMPYNTAVIPPDREEAHLSHPRACIAVSCRIAHACPASCRAHALQGTGFYALQSCVNHSCAPNAAATCLPSGQMVLRALTDIAAGSEVLLSYIEEEGAGLQERRAMLRDYGFVCSCERCSAEELAGALQAQQLVAA